MFIESRKNMTGETVLSIFCSANKERKNNWIINVQYILHIFTANRWIFNWINSGQNYIQLPRRRMVIWSSVFGEVLNITSGMKIGYQPF
jgi:hypothetical protein